ncbi:MAG: hypothetical protein ACR2FU_09325 [Streptosporangiaceae bacterium]
MAAVALGGAALVAGPAAALAQPAAPAQTVVVGCSTASLVSAINTANTSVTATTLQLSSNCTYTLFAPAAPGDGLPKIIKDITLAGGLNTVIRRSSGASFRLLDVATTGNLTVIKVSLLNGNSTGPGGGIRDAGSLAVTNSTISGNRASDGGGVDVATGGSATITSTLVNLNTTTNVGGGAVIAFGFVRLVNSVLDHNTAPSNGGGLNVQPAGNAVLQQTTVTNNTSGGFGGGIINLGRLSLSGSQVRLNQGSNGGGIYTSNTNVTLTSTIIKKNTPNNCAPITISGCVN